MKITVCIVDDNKDIRQALEEVIKLSDDYVCIGSFASCEEALDGIPDVHPHVVLMDINLGTGSGIDCVRKLKPQVPDILYMMCTVSKKPLRTNYWKPSANCMRVAPP